MFAAAAGAGMASRSADVEDLIEGLNEWRNIQDVVRCTFKALHDALKHQGDNVRALEKAVESKAGRDEVAAAVQGAVSRSELAKSLAQVSRAVAQKADAGEVEAQLGERVLRSELAAVAEAAAASARRYEARSLQAQQRSAALELQLASLQEASGRAIDALQGELQRTRLQVEDLQHSLAAKAEAEEVLTLHAAVAEKADIGRVLGLEERQAAAARACADSAASLRAECAAASSGARLQTEAQLGQVAEGVKHTLAKEVTACRTQVRVVAERVEADGDATARALRGLSTTFDAGLADLRAAVATQQQTCNATLQRLSSEVERVKEEVASKVGAGEVRRQLAATEAAAAVAAAEACPAAPAAAAASASATAALAQAAAALEKAAAVGEALEECARVGEVNSALALLEREVAEKAGADQVRLLLDQQRLLGAGPCAGRWLWEGGVTSSGQQVLWSRQCFKTQGEGLRWQEGSAAIHVGQAGLYEVAFGFFTPRKPQVQLLLNKEPVLAAVNSCSYTVHHSSGRITGLARHPAGAVTGLTLVDFLALPANSTISVHYSPSPKPAEHVQGFLSLQLL